MQKQKEVFVINTTKEHDFLERVNILLTQGWQINSSSAQTHLTGFCSYMAIMVRSEEMDEVQDVKIYPNINNLFEVQVFREKVKFLSTLSFDKRDYVSQFNSMIESINGYIQEQL